MPSEILLKYGILNPLSIKPFGNGLINNTWQVHTSSRDYLLQRINQQVFKEPEHIAHNLQMIAEFLEDHQPGYFFPPLVKTLDGKRMVHDSEKGYFRLFHFVSGSCSYDVAPSPRHAYEAARQFGLFTRVLSGISVDQLKNTIPDFHNLALRFEQFKISIQKGNPLRIQEAEDEIQFILKQEWVVEKFNQIRSNSEFKLRITHHDTKISNVLFDRNGNGLCVVDLDTVMPGYFLSDVGDMMRTYLSAVSEEEKDFSKIEVRDEFFAAILNGYLTQMEGELTEEEINNFVYSGLFMTYMQATRFLTDYLNNDVYYGSAYDKHNFMRAKNQITLFKRLMEKEEKFSGMVRKSLTFKV